MRLVNMEGYEERMTTSLSGGQQQRIAIARAIVNEPVDVVIRPEDLVIGKKDSGFTNGIVTNLIYKGAYYDISVAAGFTVIPLLVIIKYAVSDGNNAFTLSNILAIFEPVNLKALVFSLEIALGCTIVCVLLAYPLVLAISRLKFAIERGKQKTYCCFN